MAFDYKKEYKDLYLPKQKPMIIDVPSMTFVAVNGKGNPNTSEEYKNALGILYGVSFSIKMSKMSGNTPANYFDYVVPPLEGLWWGEGDYFDGVNIIDKDKLCWTSMIRLPEFVTPKVFEEAIAILGKKKPELDLSRAELFTFTEGLCAQIMHLGSYDDEPASIALMEKFIEESGCVTDISGDGKQDRKHHEIYLSDPRKTAPEKLRTVIRHPIRHR